MQIYEPDTRHVTDTGLVHMLLMISAKNGFRPRRLLGVRNLLPFLDYTSSTAVFLFIHTVY